MQRTRRLSLRALAVIALAALAVIVPAQADEQPPQPLDPWAGLTYAVRARAAAEAHWYVTVSEANERAATLRAVRSRHAGAPARLDGDRFDRLAQCESGGDWNYNGSSGFDGGLQFSPSTWTSYGGAEFAPYAWGATREQQIDVAQRVLADQGWGAWPACSRSLGLR